jgi:hypothetical protein
MTQCYSYLVAEGHMMTPEITRRFGRAGHVPPGRERRAQPEWGRFESTAHDDVSPPPSLASAIHPAAMGQLK